VSGTVFDIGYQRYTGVREGRARSRLGIYKDGIRIALGRGRGGRAKILPVAFISVLAAVGLIMSLVAGAANRFAGAGAATRLNLPTHSDLYGIASIIVFVFASVVAPELLCRDKREGTINLYLVRPLTGTDYIVPRWAAFLTVMTLALWLPQVILFIGLSMSDAHSVDYVIAHWTDIPKFLLAGLAMSVYATTLAMLVASFTSRRAYASVFLVGLFLISTPFTVGTASAVRVEIGQWISMFNLTNIPVHVNDIIFGKVSDITKDAPAKNLDESILVAWYFLWTLAPMLWLWSRYRRLSA
jgi:ABC-2 type transport system permease protein